ncbi:hypothetical protein [Candidiatus Paracoxiella cheracis]|uniref:hypothetical protein n=1 Tax=Candidiatus Paracoxiella cheracis TaxID=3405120 RepID=UPI003BF47AEB
MQSLTLGKKSQPTPEYAPSLRSPSRASIDCLNLAYDDPLFQEKYRALNTKYKALSKIQEIATSLATFYQAEAKNISEAAEKAIKKLQDIVNEFPQDANSSLEETAKKLSEGIQNYEAARKEHLKVRKIKVSYKSRWRTNPERLAVIEAMLKMTDKLFDGTMTVNDFQNSVADRQQDVRDSHANSCFTCKPSDLI